MKNVVFTEDAILDLERLGTIQVEGWSLRKIYWRLVPFDWRPGQVWYRLRCFFWNRYTTVRPKTLSQYGHGWVDRDVLLLHCCFAILSDFVEKEYDQMNVDAARMRMRVEPAFKKYVREMDLLKELYHWWKFEYPWAHRKMKQEELLLLERTQLHRLISLRHRLWT